MSIHLTTLTHFCVCIPYIATAELNPQNASVCGCVLILILKCYGWNEVNIISQAKPVQRFFNVKVSCVHYCDVVMYTVQ